MAGGAVTDLVLLEFALRYGVTAYSLSLIAVGAAVGYAVGRRRG